MNPLSDVMGGWSIWEMVNGQKQLTTECIENVVLMMPFTGMVMWTFDVEDRVVWKSTKLGLIFSMSIEMLQLLLRLGTFQVSDIVYNTLGGYAGRNSVLGSKESIRKAVKIGNNMIYWG